MGMGCCNSLASHCLRVMCLAMGASVFGWRPDLSTFSWPGMPPAFHLPSNLPRQPWVSSFGAVSANEPHAMHQKIGSLTTTVCLRPVLPVLRAAFTAREAQVAAACPLHDCGGSLLQDIDFVLQVWHHHPAPRRRIS